MTIHDVVAEITAEAKRMFERHETLTNTGKSLPWWKLSDMEQETWRNAARRARRKNYQDTDADDPDIIRMW
jgi:hypothetical protein